MPLIRLELCDFKSYRGHQVIDFGRHQFACIIGPNGSGKSNLMDAISFVLGVKSSQLRSTMLKDLIYRGRQAAMNPDDDQDEGDHETATLGKRKTREDDPEASDDEQGQATQSRGLEDATSAWVMAVYTDLQGKEYQYKRSISSSGQSTYSMNGRNVTYLLYNQSLEKHNILVKAKNFLVFQGDVEAVASQNPKELSKLVDQISG